MPETFSPSTWADGSAGGTPITAAQLNRIENGIESMDDRITAVEDTASIMPSVTYGGSGNLVASDAGKVVEMNSASSSTVSILTGVFPVGTVIEVLRLGAGSVTLVAGTGVTLRVPTGSPLTVRAQYSSISLRQRATDEWVVSGDLG